MEHLVLCFVILFSQGFMLAIVAWAHSVSISCGRQHAPCEEGTSLILPEAGGDLLVGLLRLMDDTASCKHQIIIYTGRGRPKRTFLSHHSFSALAELGDSTVSRVACTVAPH